MSGSGRKRPGPALAGAAGAFGLAVVALWAARQAGAGSAHEGRTTGEESAATQLVAGAPDQPITEILSGIDFEPTRSALDDLMGAAAPDELVALARGDDAVDPGVRLRAYRALALYASPQIESALRSAIEEHGAVGAGVDTVHVRAAMDSLASVAPDTAVSTVAPMLAHPSRDVRAGAARALGATGSDSVIPYLRARLAEETVLQVRLAIADALRRVDKASRGR